MTDSRPAESEPFERFHKAVHHLSIEIAEMRQIVAALVIVLSDDSGTAEVHEAGDALAHWAMQEFDFEILTETLGDYLPDQQPQETPPAETQHELFSAGADEIDPT